MKKSWQYSILGIIVWSLIYITFNLTSLANSTIFNSLPQIILTQLFLFFIPGLIIGLLFYEIGNIKKEKARKQSFWAVIIILLIFLITYRCFY